MHWTKFSSELYIGRKSVPVRSLKCQDELGHWRRYRACTLWNLQRNEFSRRPAQARLVKDKQGRLGVVITGKGSGFVKVGKDKGIQQVIVTSLDTISKKGRVRLLRQVGGEVSEYDGEMVITN